MQGAEAASAAWASAAWWLMLIAVSLACLVLVRKVLLSNPVGSIRHWYEACSWQKGVCRKPAAVVPEAGAASPSWVDDMVCAELQEVYAGMVRTCFVCIVGPFCFLTVLLSVLRDDIAFPDLRLNSNMLPLMVATLLTVCNPPARRTQLGLWLLLAFWFSSTLAAHLLLSEWHLHEQVWLNHMFFVTVVSEVLQMPPLLIWANTLLHSAFFIALTVVNDYPSDSPSLELQLLMVIVRIACGHYTQLVSKAVEGCARADVLAQDASKLAALSRSAAEQALVEADEEATRARTAQVELSLAEAEARAVESVRSAQLHLLKVMCDAVIEVDADMQIIEPGKLGLMLYQSSHRNLAGTRFVDLLNPKEVDRFQCFCRDDQLRLYPLQTTLTGAYNMAISVSIYLATLSPSTASGRVTHLLGVNEIQEAQPANARPHADTVLSGLGPVADDVSCDDSEEGMQSPYQSAHSCHSGSQKSPRASSDYPPRPEPPAEFRQLEPEEELRALMSFLWQWPLPERGKGLSQSCCQTHQTLDRARDALRYLQKLDCQDVPACLGWQCPACKLKGTESDRRLFDEESWCCGRCANWEDLYL